MKPRMAAALGASKYTLRDTVLAVRKRRTIRGMGRKELREGNAPYTAELMYHLARERPRGAWWR